MIAVRGGVHDVSRPGIVVGVDGSAASEAALGFALEEAALRHGTVHVLCSWCDTGLGDGMGANPFATDAHDDEHVAAARFQHLVAPWLSGGPSRPARLALLRRRRARQARRHTVTKVPLMNVPRPFGCAF